MIFFTLSRNLTSIFVSRRFNWISSQINIPLVRSIPCQNFSTLPGSVFSPRNAIQFPRLSIDLFERIAIPNTTIPLRPLRLCIFDAKSIYKPRAKCNFHFVHTVHTVATFCKILFSNLDPRASNSFVILLILFSPHPFLSAIFSPPTIERRRRRRRRLLACALGQRVTRRITYVSGVK